ncbi:MAG: HAD-IA family hydrolase [Pseudomonadota bacterium]
MSDPQRLIVFDMDGTLVDSQATIVGCMQAGFAAVDQAPPDRARILSIVGLSLNRAVEQLAPELDAVTRDRIVQTYKDSFVAQRETFGSSGSSPLFPGVRCVLDQLHSIPHWLMGIATGKSRRGLDALVDAHDLRHFFVTQQVADYHPSKPHPSMLQAAMDEAGVSPSDTIMIGDTTFDLDMATAAGVPFIGVSWGYHPISSLKGARAIIEEIATLPDVLNGIWKSA